jgi:hypothetical protein
LLAAMEGGKPLNEATWILVGAVLTTVVDAYATHMSGRHEGGVSAYFGSLYRGIVNDLPRIHGRSADRADTRLGGDFPLEPRSPEPRRQCDGRLRNHRSERQRRVVVHLLDSRRIRERFLMARNYPLCVLNALLGWIVVTVELALE